VGLRVLWSRQLLAAGGSCRVPAALAALARLMGAKPKYNSRTAVQLY
jgi:hypothetical protein